MTKYATLNRYQPYIDAIKADLGIQDTEVNITFRPAAKYSDGAASQTKSGVPSIRVNNNRDHARTLWILMHELKHIEQYVSGTLGYSRGYKIWKGEKYKGLNVAKAVRNGVSAVYNNQPWEVDANNYANTQNTLFPNGMVNNSTRVFIGANEDVKMYKIKKVSVK